MEMTDAIGQHLQYFQELESATRMLNHPGESLVLQVDFLYMVERVDLCIEYFKQHVRAFMLEPIRLLTPMPTEKFQRVGFISPAVPAMHDASNDAYQDVLRGIGESPDNRHISETFRKRRFDNSPTSFALYEVYVRIVTAHSLTWRIRTKGPDASGRTFCIVGRMPYGILYRTEEFTCKPTHKRNQRARSNPHGAGGTCEHPVPMLCVPIRGGLTSLRPGQAVATSNNFALTSSNYSARSFVPGRPCYSREITPVSDCGTEIISPVNISRTCAITSTMTSGHEFCTSPASPFSVMFVPSSRRSWYWTCRPWSQTKRRTSPAPSPKMNTDPRPRGGLRGLGGSISVDCFRWCCKTLKRDCSSRRSR